MSPSPPGLRAFWGLKTGLPHRPLSPQVPIFWGPEDWHPYFCKCPYTLSMGLRTIPLPHWHPHMPPEPEDRAPPPATDKGFACALSEPINKLAPPMAVETHPNVPHRGPGKCPARLLSLLPVLVHATQDLAPHCYCHCR